MKVMEQWIKIYFLDELVEDLKLM